jgi:hypothetical protein
MSETQTRTEVPQLAYLGNIVPEGYEYREKLITPGADLILAEAYLKWYNLNLPDEEIAQESIEESRAFIATAVERLQIRGEFGFVILHLCGSVLLLMLTTWRNTNEMWEVAYTKDLTRPGGYQPQISESDQRGTYCVWELGIVWHERGAWTRFLKSRRDDAAKLAYINDKGAGSL